MNDDTALLTTEQVIAYWESRIEKNPFLAQYLGAPAAARTEFVCMRCGWMSSWVGNYAHNLHNCDQRAACIAACDAGLTELSVPDVNNLPIWLMGVAKCIPETSIGGESIHLVWVPRWWLNATKRLRGSIGDANAPDRKESLQILNRLASAIRGEDQQAIDHILGILERSQQP